ncbi:MAG: hypothetical protein NWF06_03795 [Candidatus Bathyarchaeota archaeon]|nr:hypothetical protein [Candidatus Bathyarchaeum sp.]
MDKDVKANRSKIVEEAIRLIDTSQNDQQFFDEIAIQFQKANETLLTKHMVAKLLKWLCDRHKLPQLKIEYVELPQWMDGLYTGETNTVQFKNSQCVTLLTLMEEFGHHVLWHQYNGMYGHNDIHKTVIETTQDYIKNIGLQTYNNNTHFFV